MKRILTTLTFLLCILFSYAGTKYTTQVNKDGSIILTIQEVNEESGEVLSTVLLYFKDKNAFYTWQKSKVTSLKRNAEKSKERAEAISEIEL